jgi:hypothetical protein
VALAAPGGGCLEVHGGGYQGGAGGLIVAACNATDPAQTVFVPRGPSWGV